ncbi:hypothetical protein COLSTE_01345 [Collinsella stercoris DSM 13279]|uniref:Uncharacterized protein n=1 Tax=Collinsella stercoris DSM 13279 TaxID=445975 RepID=B6GB87_9ACTN|nr:hypothetical protein COLSTE_01345 [Collinsella stercoris DSM 13279]
MSTAPSERFSNVWPPQTLEKRSLGTIPRTVSCPRRLPGRRGFVRPRVYTELVQHACPPQWAII